MVHVHLPISVYVSMLLFRRSRGEGEGERGEGGGGGGRGRGGRGAKMTGQNISGRVGEGREVMNVHANSPNPCSQVHVFFKGGRGPMVYALCPLQETPCIMLRFSV